MSRGEYNAHEALWCGAPVELIDGGRTCITNATPWPCSEFCDGMHATGKLDAVRVGGRDGVTLYSKTPASARRRAQRIARTLGCKVTVSDEEPS